MLLFIFFLLSAVCNAIDVPFDIAVEGEYVLGSGEYACDSVDIGSSTTSLKGSGRILTSLDLKTCGNHLFLISNGYLSVESLTFTYELNCVHTIATVTNADGIVNFTNVDVNQTLPSVIASSIFNLAGHGLFTNFTVTYLNISSISNTLFYGSPVELFFNVCTISHIKFNAAVASPCIIISDTADIRKSYFFNNTDFLNISQIGSSVTGGLFFFDSSVTDSSYTFETCTFRSFELAIETRGGIVFTTTSGALNITLSTFDNVTKGRNGSLIYSSLPTCYIGRSNFLEMNSYQYGLVWINAGTLALSDCIFNELSSNYKTAGVWCLGSAMTIMGTNFTNMNSTGNNTGVSMENSDGFLSITDVLFYNLKGANNTCFYSLCETTVKNTQFLNSTATGRPVGWYAQKAITVTNCLHQFLSAGGLSAACIFYGGATWYSCRFINITANGNGGMCCQWSALSADNCSFVNLSAQTNSAIGGAIHWHSGFTTLTRCKISNCSAAGRGGGIDLGSEFFIVNCEFENNTARIYGTDMTFSQSSDETYKLSHIYGSCSTSSFPRVDDTNSNNLLRDCNEDGRYVNMTIRDGQNQDGCGQFSDYPCLTISYTATQYLTSIPMYLVVDYGVFPETEVVLVEKKPMYMNGTEVEDKESIVLFGSDSLEVLFSVTTGSLTVDRITFRQSRGADGLSRAMISVSGNGTMALRSCRFGLDAPGSTYSYTDGVVYNPAPNPIARLQSAIIHIGDISEKTVCNFENCVFRDVIIEDNSTLFISKAKSVEMVGIEFTNVSSTLVTDTAGLQAPGAIYSNALQLSVSQGRFQQCTTARNGGAIGTGTGNKVALSISECVFDRCTAASSGGAIYIGTSNTSANLRYIVRSTFLNNVASNVGMVADSGNDIRDVSGVTDSWNGANAVDDCSSSDYRKFYVGTEGNFESYLPLCFHNPCLDHTETDCPLECAVADGGDCIADTCTRLHHETLCSGTCMMYGENNDCVPDPCYDITMLDECQTNHECHWDYPTTTNLSTGEPVIDPNTKVCEAVGLCTRQPGETECPARCVFDQDGYCVPDKCLAYTTAFSLVDCPLDCDFAVSNGCKATICTRHTTADTECLLINQGCILEDDDGTYNGRCSVDPCFGKAHEDCTPECKWDVNTCKQHICTRLHNETDCVRHPSCVKDEDGYCVIDPCFGMSLDEYFVNEQTRTCEHRDCEDLGSLGAAVCLNNPACALTETLTCSEDCINTAEYIKPDSRICERKACGDLGTGVCLNNPACALTETLTCSEDCINTAEYVVNKQSRRCELEECKMLSEILCLQNNTCVFAETGDCAEECENKEEYKVDEKTRTCILEECPRLSENLCLMNSTCVLIGSSSSSSSASSNNNKNCIFNDCDNGSRKNVDEDCDEGCEYVAAARRCEPDGCRPHSANECNSSSPTPTRATTTTTGDDDTAALKCNLISVEQDKRAERKRGKSSYAHSKSNLVSICAAIRVPPPIARRQSSSFPWWILILIAIALVAVGMIVAAALVYKRRKKQPTDDFSFSVEIDLKDGEGLDIGGGDDDFGFDDGKDSCSGDNADGDLDKEKDTDDGSWAAEGAFGNTGEYGFGPDLDIADILKKGGAPVLDLDGDGLGDDKEKASKKKKAKKVKRDVSLSGLGPEDPEAYAERMLGEVDTNFGETEGLEFQSLAEMMMGQLDRDKPSDEELRRQARKARKEKEKKKKEEEEAALKKLAVSASSASIDMTRSESAVSLAVSYSPKRANTNANANVSGEPQLSRSGSSTVSLAVTRSGKRTKASMARDRSTATLSSSKSKKGLSRERSTASIKSGKKMKSSKSKKSLSSFPSSGSSSNLRLDLTSNTEYGNASSISEGSYNVRSMHKLPRNLGGVNSKVGAGDGKNGFGPPSSSLAGLSTSTSMSSLLNVSDLNNGMGLDLGELDVSDYINENPSRSGSSGNLLVPSSSSLVSLDVFIGNDDGWKKKKRKKKGKK